MTAQTVRVTCITKRGNHHNPHERIQGIGGTNPDGKRWWMSEDDAITAIKVQRYAFYVSVNGKGVWVVVANHLGREYLKTEPDAYPQNNLLNLPECQ